MALAPVEPLIKDGKFRALAVTGAERWFSLPDVPTMIESGFPGFVSDTFNALFAPAGTAPEIIALLSRETRATLKTPQAREELDELTALVRAGRRVCLLCYERDPHVCHRRRIAELLSERTGARARDLIPALV